MVSKSLSKWVTGPSLLPGTSYPCEATITLASVYVRARATTSSALP